MAEALIDVRDYSAPSPVLPLSDTVIGLVVSTDAAATNGQLPTGATLPAVNTPTLISSLREARDTFGWLHAPAGLSGGTLGTKTYGAYSAVPYSSGSGANLIYRNSAIRALEAIFANTQDHVVVSLFDGSTVSTARDTAITNAATALRDNNKTRYTPNLVCIPMESWGGGATPVFTKRAAVLDVLETVCEDISAFGIVSAPPSTSIANIKTWAANVEVDNANIGGFWPLAIPTFDNSASTPFDISPFVAGAIAAEDEAGQGRVGYNPRGTIIRGIASLSPELSHSPISGTVDTAELRSVNINPIAYRGGYKILGTKALVPVTATYPERFINVLRVKDAVNADLEEMLETASELLAIEARAYALDHGTTILRHYEALGELTDPSIQLDPDVDDGVSEHIYLLSTWNSLKPTEKVTLRTGPRS